jgi:small subunit ribosomal protein S2
VPTPTVNMKDLLVAGVHFGHQTRRWNPKMKPYIFGERGGIYIIDLQKTTLLIDEAYAFLKQVTGRGGSVLFVGTKKQCQESVKEQAERVGQPYVCNRWLGGLLTNFATLSKRIKRLHELRKLVEDGSIDLLPTREAMGLKADLAKLETNLGGVAGMERLPAAVFVVDPRKEAIVIKEARKLNIPIIALVDTNCDPDEVDYLIPGNDDAIRSCSLIVKTVADAVADGRAKVAEDEFRAAQERAAAEKAAAEKAAAEAAVTAAADAERVAAEKAAQEAASAERAANAQRVADELKQARTANAPVRAKAPAADAAARPAKAEAKPAEGDAKPAAKVEAKPAAKVEAKPEAKVEAKPAAKVEARPAAKAEAKPAAKVEAKPEAKVEAKPAAKAEAKVAKDEAKPAAKDEAKAAAKAEATPVADEPKPARKAAAKKSPATADKPAEPVAEETKDDSKESDE